MPDRDPADVLAELAAKATPGPYVASTSPEAISYGSLHVYSSRFNSAVVYGRTWCAERNGADDVRYFAACSPDRILALIRRVREAEAVCKAADAWFVADPYMHGCDPPCGTPECALHAAIARWLGKAGK